MRSRLLRLLPGLVVSAVFTWWFVAGADWASAIDALRQVQLPWVVAAAAVLFTEFLIRALRWRVLLRSLAPTARYSRLLVATLIGMALNVVLPFRAGDLARPWLGSRETGLPLLPLVTVAVFERVFDLVGLLGVFLMAVALLPHSADSALIASLRVGGLVFGGAGLLGLGGMVWAAANEARTRGIYEWLLRFLPGPVAGRFRVLFQGLATGLRGARDPVALAEALALSLLHWFNGTVSIWLLFHAFGLPLPFGAACFTSVLLALTVILPQAPGFIGPFQFGVANALRIWGVPGGAPDAYAIVFWAVSFVPVTTVGGLLALREGLDRRILAGQPAELDPTPGR